MHVRSIDPELATSLSASRSACAEIQAECVEAKRAIRDATCDGKQGHDPETCGPCEEVYFRHIERDIYRQEYASIFRGWSDE